MFDYRIASALVMFPAVVGPVWLGSPVFDLMTALFAVAMAWEWENMTTRGNFGREGIVVALTGAGAAVIAAYYPLLALLLAGGGAVIAGLGAGDMWRVFGALYIAIPCIALVWLRTAAVDGLETLTWLLLVVWSTDIGAYGVGRCIGGPRLAPSISPNKTWAGAFGGLCAAMGVGSLIAVLLDVQTLWSLVVASAGVSVVSQFGDLAESKIKRYFGVKDSGRIIPGHGGIFDRVDGILAAAPVVVSAVLISGGGVRLWGQGLS